MNDFSTAFQCFRKNRKVALSADEYFLDELLFSTSSMKNSIFWIVIIYTLSRMTSCIYVRIHICLTIVHIYQFIYDIVLFLQLVIAYIYHFDLKAIIF